MVNTVVPAPATTTPTTTSTKDSQKMVDLVLRMAMPLKDSKAFFKLKHAEEIGAVAALMDGNAAGDDQKAWSQLWNGLTAEQRAEYNEKVAK